MQLQIKRIGAACALAEVGTSLCDLSIILTERGIIKERFMQDLQLVQH